MDTMKDTKMPPVKDAVIEELRKVSADCYWPTSPVTINNLLDRLEAAERKAEMLHRLLNAKQIDHAVIQEQNSALRAKVEAMERQEPIGTAHAMPGASAFTMACFDVQDIPVGSKLYALPGAQNVPEKLCYDSRWEISIDYVDGWNAAVDMMRGKSPSWHCPDCCIAFPFGAPKSCPNDDARCNKLLAAGPEAKP